MKSQLFMVFVWMLGLSLAAVPCMLIAAIWWHTEEGLAILLKLFVSDFIIGSVALIALYIGWRDQIRKKR